MTYVKGAIAWLLTAPLLVFGLLAGHAAGYRWAVPDPHQRQHLLDASGHAYSRYLPIVIAVAATLLLASLAWRVRAAIAGQTLLPPPWLLALLPPFAFLVQEYVERLLSSGHVHLDTLWAPPVLVGLQLQIPFALLALLAARLLARAADVLGQALAAAPHPIRVELAVSRHPLLQVPAPARVAARGWTDRGPPSF
jgi:hypothetical protein